MSDGCQALDRRLSNLKGREFQGPSARPEEWGAGVQALRLRTNDEWVRPPQKFTYTAEQVLRHLSIPASVFWTPPKEKIGGLRL